MMRLPNAVAARLDGVPRTWLGALALSVVAVIAYLAVVLPAERDLASLERRVSALQARTAMAGKMDRMNPARQLEAFYDQFPGRDSTPDWLHKINAAAQAHRLQLMQGDYRLVDDPEGGLTRYQISLPLHGAYPDIRSFIRDVLVQVPAVALDNISFERQKIGDPGVQATVRMTLYLRRTS